VTQKSHTLRSRLTATQSSTGVSGLGREP